MPDTSTEVAIATTTLSSATSTITLSSIPATYTDLRLVIVGTSATSTPYVDMNFNGDFAANYGRLELTGDGATAASFQQINRTFLLLNYLNTTNPTMAEVNIFSYAGSTFKTSLISANYDNNGTGTTARRVGTWRSTAAITSISLKAQGGSFNFAAGTTATLYGIL